MTQRRDFLKLLGIGSAAGMAGCSRSAPDSLVSYVVPPEELVRGNAIWYRTTCQECPAGCGIEARVREGRVLKVEGNPHHPVNGGGVCARGQAALQGSYNPDRLRGPQGGWDDALKRAADGLRGGAVVLTGAMSGAAAELCARLGRHVQWEPVGYEALREANRLSFGVAGLPVLRFSEARTVFVFGADVVGTYVSPVGYARGIAEARPQMVYFGARMSLTGARADQWVATEPGQEGVAALAIVRAILAAGGGEALGAAREQVRAWVEPYTPQRAGIPAGLIAKLIRKEQALAVAGDSSVFTGVAVNLLNAATGALNTTVRFDRASVYDGLATHAEVEAALAAASAVLVWGANPAYASPSLAALLKSRPFVAVLASWPDETTTLAKVVLPVHTPLESWGDLEPWTGIHSLVQPAMRPVFETRDAGDVLAQLSGVGKPFREIVRERWSRIEGAPPWEAALQEGGYWRDVPERKVALALKAIPEPPEKKAPYRLETYPSMAHFDGRGANRPWLQELPDPITQVVWDSWVEINPADAARAGISTGDRVIVQSRHGMVETAAYVYPGLRPGAVAMPLGQGHTVFGRYATGVGANAAVLGNGEDVRISLVRKAKDLVVVAGHDSQEGRGIARSAGEHHAHHAEEMSIYPPHGHEGRRWAMAVDLDACNGCSACVTACYAENNVPVVGRDQVRRGRNMSWLRVQRYFGPAGKPFQVDFTLMLCQQCDKAPCETVCPVYASYHTAEGLNGQVYNRCVGTRYCANNCPYKTRRFNWYQAEFPAPLDWQLNPDVTVRSKGVMEKCTFCVQRINAAKIAGGEPVPACAQSCPTGAIVFGDLNDKNSRIAKVMQDPRRYRVFEELNTRPAVHYLERERRQV